MGGGHRLFGGHVDGVTECGNGELVADVGRDFRRRLTVEVEDDDLRSVLDAVCDLYALSVVEADKAWFLEHRRLSVGRAKNVTSSVNALCERLRPHAADLVDAFGIPEHLLDVEMLR